VSEEIAALWRRAERERAARKQAEKLLEEKSLELYFANQRLKGIAENLEHEVEQRTIELKDAVLAAEKAAHAKGEFLAMMSHEIRTPLNGILGTVELLNLSDNIDAEQKEYVQLIRHSGETLLVLINDILDFSKIEAGSLDLEQRAFLIRPELTSLLALYRPLADEKNIALVGDFHAELPETLITDKTRLRQIIGNLVTNAIKFTPQGSVTLTVAWDSSNTETPTLKVSVTDTGIGIAEENMDRLFKPFSQADSSTTRKYGGTGLGLVICERLVEALGGTLTVVSRLGQGSIFSFQIPANNGTLLKNPPQTLDSNSCNVSIPLKILLVEDNAINQFVIIKLLEKQGYSADVANNGIVALAKVQATRYDLILMDMQMPEMDGLEATMTIRKMQLPVQPRIIGLTANAFDTDRDKCIAAGMNGFVTKPISVNELRTQLCAACLSLR
jgi:signal transduction histidine kinase